MKILINCNMRPDTPQSYDDYLFWNDQDPQCSHCGAWIDDDNGILDSGHCEKCQPYCETCGEVLEDGDEYYCKECSDE